MKNFKYKIGDLITYNCGGDAFAPSKSIAVFSVSECLTAAEFDYQVVYVKTLKGSWKPPPSKDVIYSMQEERMRPYINLTKEANDIFHDILRNI